MGARQGRGTRPAPLAFVTRRTEGGQFNVSFEVPLDVGDFVLLTRAAEG